MHMKAQAGPHPGVLSWEVQGKPQACPAPDLQKLLGANVVFSLYKFHPCIKAPELFPTPLPKLNSNLI